MLIEVLLTIDNQAASQEAESYPLYQQTIIIII